MIDVNDICLISPIEQNKRVLCWDNQFHTRYFEDECVRMVKYWRKYAGWLKNINIYIFNVNGAIISDKTIDKLNSFNCIYQPYNSENYEEMGFLTEPLCGKIAEQQVKENILIKIDLDMCIARPLGSKLIEESKDYTLIEQYTNSDSKQQRNCIGNFNPFDTCFIISNKNSHFYEKYFELCHSKIITESPEWKKLKTESGDYFIDEFVIDYMYKNNICNIKPMNNHIYGEGYREMECISDEDFKKINFIHCHINKNNPQIENSTFKKYIFRSIQKGNT